MQIRLSNHPPEASLLRLFKLLLWLGFIVDCTFGYFLLRYNLQEVPTAHETDIAEETILSLVHLGCKTAPGTEREQW